MNPDEVALAFAAADEVTSRRARTSRAAELAVERARYDADRAERAFHAAEPENRLVTRTLEARWETTLATLAQAEAALTATHAAAPPLPARADLETLLTDLPRLWHAETTSARDRKRLLRTLIADLTVLPETTRDTVRVGIRWHTGATEEITTPRPLPPGPAKRTPSPAAELIRRLGPTTNNEDLVDIPTPQATAPDTAAPSCSRATSRASPAGLSVTAARRFPSLDPGLAARRRFR